MAAGNTLRISNGIQKSNHPMSPRSHGTTEMKVPRNHDKDAPYSVSHNDEYWNWRDSTGEITAAILFFATFGILPILLIGS